MLCCCIYRSRDWAEGLITSSNSIFSLIPIRRYCQSRSMRLVKPPKLRFRIVSVRIRVGSWSETRLMHLGVLPLLSSPACANY